MASEPDGKALARAALVAAAAALKEGFAHPAAKEASISAIRIQSLDPAAQPRELLRPVTSTAARAYRGQEVPASASRGPATAVPSHRDA
jgi:hypothetical protein